MEEARKPENLPKNRYRDILPCKLQMLQFFQDNILLQYIL